MAKFACHYGAFSENFELEASPPKGQSLKQKDKKRSKVKGEKTRKLPGDIGHFSSRNKKCWKMRS